MANPLLPVHMDLSIHINSKVLGYSIHLKSFVCLSDLEECLIDFPTILFLQGNPVFKMDPYSYLCTGLLVIILIEFNKDQVFG
jgi:hypothetical protein